MIKNPYLQQLVTTTGEIPVEGIIKIIEKKTVDNKSIATYVYVTLNKGQSHPNEMFFDFRKGGWYLLRVPVSDIVPRKPDSEKVVDVYKCIETNNIKVLKTLKPRSLNKKPKTNSDLRSYENSLGYALRFGSLESIKYLVEQGIPFKFTGTYYSAIKDPFQAILMNQTKELDLPETWEYLESIGQVFDANKSGEVSNMCMSGDRDPIYKKLKFLLEEKPEAVKKDSRNPLGAALYNGQGKTVKLFIDHGYTDLEKSMKSWAGSSSNFGHQQLKENGYSMAGLLGYVKSRKFIDKVDKIIGE